VVIFAYSFAPENVIGAAWPFRFSKYLSRLGYTCRVFTASDQTGRDDSNTEYTLYKGFDFYEDEAAEFHVMAPKTLANPLVETMWEFGQDDLAPRPRIRPFENLERRLP